MSQLTIRSKKEAVYDWLLTQIITGAFAPNEALVIDELARTLAVSAIPVREALQQLESEGFVVIKPFAGATVADLQPGMIIEIFGLLEAVETISGRMACINICDENLIQIEQLLREMDDLLDDPDRWSEKNAHFHMLICECSGAMLITDTMSRMLLHWDRVRRHYLDDVFGKRIAKAHQDHWQMFYAISDKDPDRLEAIVRGHNRSAMRDYIDYLHRVGFSDDQVPAVWNLN